MREIVCIRLKCVQLQLYKIMFTTRRLSTSHSQASRSLENRDGESEGRSSAAVVNDSYGDLDG